MEVLVDISQHVVFLLRVKHDGAHRTNRSPSDLMPHMAIASRFLGARTIDGGLLPGIKIVHGLCICKELFDRICIDILVRSAALVNKGDLPIDRPKQEILISSRSFIADHPEVFMNDSFFRFTLK